MTITGEIVIRRPVDDVFDYVADERNEPTFNPSMTSVQKVTDGPIGAGTQFRATTRSMGRDQDMTIQITEYDRLRTLSSHTTLAAAEVTGRLTFSPDATGTRLQWAWDIQPRRLPTLLHPLIEVVGRRRERRIWRGLKHQLEGPMRGPARRLPEVALLGLWAAMLMTVGAAAGLLLGVTTPARSGPGCLSDCVTAPYTDIAAFVPRDYWWMYPVMVMVLCYVIVVACVHQSNGHGGRVSSLLALAFAVIPATTASIAYGIQLMVVQPDLLKGELDGLSLWSMYNPHGLFIALENLTYLLIAVSFLFLGGALRRQGGVVRAARLVLLLGGAVSIAVFVALSAVLASDLEYLYEVTALSITWLTLGTTGVLLGIAFRRQRLTASSTDAPPVDCSSQRIG